MCLDQLSVRRIAKYLRDTRGMHLSRAYISRGQVSLAGIYRHAHRACISPGVYVRTVHVMDVHVIGVHLTGIYLMSVTS
jgi:hypothetical protein